MDGSDIQPLPPSLRNLQPSPLQTIPPDGSVPGQLAPEFDPNNPQSLQSFTTAIGAIQEDHLTSANAFVRHPQPGDELDKQVADQSVLHPRQPTNDHYDALHHHLQQPLEGNPMVPPQHGTGSNISHFGGLKLVPEPPNLDAWREKLFNVDETITLSEEEYVVQRIAAFCTLFMLFTLRLLTYFEIGSTSTSRTSITSTRTVLPRNINVNHSYHTTGTAD